MSDESPTPVRPRRTPDNRTAVAATLGLVALASAATVGVLAVRQAWQANEARVHDHLRAELAVHREAVRTYLDDVAGDLARLTTAPDSLAMLTSFEAAVNALGRDSGERRRRAYLDENPNPPARRDALLASRGGTAYDAVHARYHRWLRDLVDRRDYYDLFLVSAAGDVLYTVRKEADFASDLLGGPFADTELANTFVQLRDGAVPGTLAFRDFMPYGPSADEPAAFVGTSLHADGRFAGALIVQLRARPLGARMNTARALGESGKAYLVGADRLTRSASRVGEGRDALELGIDTPSVARALTGLSGVHSIEDHRGVPALSAHAPLVWNGVRWAIVVEIDRAEVERPVRELGRRLLFGGALCALLATLLGWAIGAPGANADAWRGGARRDGVGREGGRRGDAPHAGT